MKLLVAILFLAQISFAADYIVGIEKCDEKIELLDIYEGATIRNISFQSQPSLESLLVHLRHRMPERESSYRMAVQDLSKKLRFQQLDLGNFPADDRLLQARPGCEFKILLKSDLHASFEVNFELWSLLEPSRQWAALINLAIAKEVQEDQSKMPSNSIYIRSLNSIIYSDLLESMDTLDLVKYLKAAGLKSYRAQGVLIDISKDFVYDKVFINAIPISGSTLQMKDQVLTLKADKISFFPSGEMRSLRFFGSYNYKHFLGDFIFSTPDNATSIPFEWEQFPSLYFFKNGEVEQGIIITASKLSNSKFEVQCAEYAEPSDKVPKTAVSFFPDSSISTISPVRGSLNFRGQKLNLENDMALEWYKDGTLKEMTTTSAVRLTVQGKAILWNGTVHFNQDGSLSSAYLAESVILNNAQGKTVKYMKGSIVYFNKSGLAL